MSPAVAPFSIVPVSCKQPSVPEAVIAIALPSAVMIDAKAAPAWSQPF